MGAALVTDSNSQVTPALRERLGLRVVPVTVVVDGVGHAEGVDLDAAGIRAALERGAAVSTSTPSPGEFLAVWEAAARDGADRVLSVHAGGAATSTARTAALAAPLAPLPVEVVDTGTASFPVALCTWAAGDVLAAGGSVQDAAAEAHRVASLVDNVFVVGTPALARRGGRLAEGTDLAQVPVLALHDGRMSAVDRVGDVEAAVAAMASYVERAAAGAPLRVGLGDLAAEELAGALERALRERCEVAELVRYVVGPSVAVHTGVGTVGCVFHPVPR